MGVNNTEGYVTIWLGYFKSNKDFNDYIKLHYECEDTVDVESQFEKDFELKYYDRDIVESVKLSSDSNTIKELFEEASYLENYINKLDDKTNIPFNAIVRVYDYKYEGEKKSTEFEDNKVVFFDNLKYEKVVDLSWMGI